jgi:hypothetical protein
MIDVMTLTILSVLVIDIIVIYLFYPVIKMNRKDIGDTIELLFSCFLSMAMINVMIGYIFNKVIELLV